MWFSSSKWLKIHLWLPDLTEAVGEEAYRPPSLTNAGPRGGDKLPSGKVWLSPCIIHGLGSGLGLGGLLLTAHRNLPTVPSPTSYDVPFRQNTKTLQTTDRQTDDTSNTKRDRWYGRLKSSSTSQDVPEYPLGQSHCSTSTARPKPVSWPEVVDSDIWLSLIQTRRLKVNRVYRRIRRRNTLSIISVETRLAYVYNMHDVPGRTRRRF